MRSHERTRRDDYIERNLRIIATTAIIVAVACMALMPAAAGLT